MHLNRALHNRVNRLSCSYTFERCRPGGVLWDTRKYVHTHGGAKDDFTLNDDVYLYCAIRIRHNVIVIVRLFDLFKSCIDTWTFWFCSRTSGIRALILCLFVRLCESREHLLEKRREEGGGKKTLNVLQFSAANGSIRRYRYASRSDGFRKKKTNWHRGPINVRSSLHPVTRTVRISSKTVRHLYFSLCFAKGPPRRRARVSNTAADRQLFADVHRGHRAPRPVDIRTAAEDTDLAVCMIQEYEIKRGSRWPGAPRNASRRCHIIMVVTSTGSRNHSAHPSAATLHENTEIFFTALTLQPRFKKKGSWTLAVCYAV